jgi:hypothetical protein
VAQDSVRKAWFAASQFFSGRGRAAQVAPADLRDRARHIRVDQANSAVVRTQQVLRGLVVIRHAREWVE